VTSGMYGTFRFSYHSLLGGHPFGQPRFPAGGGVGVDLPLAGALHGLGGEFGAGLQASPAREKPDLDAIPRGTETILPTFLTLFA
jgi:hypothetical protein